MELNASQLNDLFMQKLDSEDSREKLAAATTSYVRDKLRESAFNRKVINPQTVTKDDCQVSVNHDTLVKIVEIEPNSKAMAITFRGEADSRFISAPRVECPFFSISSEKFEKTEQELLAYQMPLTKVIEENTVKDIEEIEDFYFLNYIEAAVRNYTNPLTAANNIFKPARTSSLGTTELTPNVKADFIECKKLLSGSRRRAQRILMTEPDFDDITGYTITDFGDKIASEVIVDGYKYNLFLGMELIRTIKTDILKQGNIYFFTQEEFLGKSYVLNNTKFYIDKVGNLITWWAWEDIGMIIVNVASISKMELYKGDPTLAGNRPAVGLALEDELGGTYVEPDQVQPLVTF
ncbi:hypothetical protein LCGC14_0146920 [marine sediment metagenome]|uniref:Uncharacterized protein n=1 Tax=marine sediment metagenome TaxID=412755 RepID=A0A0F9V033_9ZZZZ